MGRVDESGAARAAATSSLRTQGLRATGVVSTVYSFGQNSYGELAHGDTVERLQPTKVVYADSLDVVQVVAGNEHTAMLTSAGDVYTVGYNDSGQCALGTTGRVPSLTLVEALRGKNVSKLYSANGCEHLMAITEDGELYSCGYNARGQLGLEHITHVCTPKLVRSLAAVRVTKVACSYYHTIVATENDVVYAFGRNDFGQLGCGTEEDTSAPKPVDALRGRHVLSIACGQYHTIVACEAPHGVVAFGKNDYGQLGVHSPNAEPKLVPTPLGPITGTGDGEMLSVTQVACGYYHTVGITEDGKVFSCGRNDYGQLGHGDRQSVRGPRLIEALRDEAIAQVSCGCYHTLFLAEDGRVFSVGRNNHGQLGINTQHDSAVPEIVPSMKPISLLAAGFYHSICMTSSDGGGTLGPTSAIKSARRSATTFARCSTIRRDRTLPLSWKVGRYTRTAASSWRDASRSSACWKDPCASLRSATSFFTI